MKFYFFPEMSLHFLMFITTVFGEVCFLFLSIENLIFNVSTANIKEPSGSSTTCLQTSRYCRAQVKFNSINLVRDGSSKTFETGLSLPGHPLVLQERFSAGDPRHLRPPWAGRGLEHVRDLVCVPSPHDLVHTLQDFHSLQLPSTGEKGPKCFKKWFFYDARLSIRKGMRL